MENKVFSNLAKGASLFLVGGVLGGVMTYSMADLNFDSNTTVAETESTVETVATEPTETEKDTYSLSESLNTVVSIDVTMSATPQSDVLSDLFGQQPQTREVSASGSGVIYSEDENGIYIITNNHVVENADTIKIRVDDNDEPAEAKLIGRDPYTDLAVIYVTKDELKAKGIDNYLVSKIGDSDDLEVFEQVYAIGNAAGEGKSGTTGTISALDKDLDMGDGTTIEAIQIDAAINPGNSGGALVNADGELIGINFAKAVSTELEGMGYSIPINDAVVVVNNIIEKGSVEAPYVQGVESKPFMGVMLYDFTKEEAAQRGATIEDDVVVVTSVIEGSPADLSQLQAGDIIVSVNGTDVNSIDEVHEEVYKNEIGDTIDITIARNGRNYKTKMTLADSAKFTE